MPLNHVNALYIVSYSWYEEYSPTIVCGPKVADWKSYCNSLLDRAVLRLLEKYTEGWAERYAEWNKTYWENIESVDDINANAFVSTMGVNDIVESLLEILQEEGYTIESLPEADYFGSCVIKKSDEKWDINPDMKNNINPALLDKMVEINTTIHDITYSTDNSDV